MSQPKLYHFLGVYSLLSAIVSGSYYALSYTTGARELLWYCNIGLIIVAFALFFKSSLWVSAVFITALPAQFFWIYGDFLMFFGQETLGRFSWMTQTSPLGMLFDFNYHFAVIPLSAYGVWKFGYHRQALWLAVAGSIVVPGLTRLLTEPIYNINCVYYPCDMEFQEAQMAGYGVTYFFTRCGFFILFSGIIHLICFKAFPKKG